MLQLVSVHQVCFGGGGGGGGGSAAGSGQCEIQKCGCIRDCKCRQTKRWYSKTRIKDTMTSTDTEKEQDSEAAGTAKSVSIKQTVWEKDEPMAVFGRNPKSP